MRSGFFGLLVILSALSACRPLPPVLHTDPHVLKVSSTVEQIRGLKFEKPVPLGRKTLGEIRRYVDGRVGAEYSPSDLENEREVLVLLGLLPPKFPYREKVLGLLSEQIAAYYDPEENALFLSDHLPSGSLDGVIAHELTHGLQQQHFGIEKYLDRKDLNDDRKLALNALIEGDAMVVMFEFEFAGKVSSEKSRQELLAAEGIQMRSEKLSDRQIAGVPKFMQEDLLFPYVEGLPFILVLRKNGGWNRVNEAYSRLPASTEQILHPQKYLKNEDPPVEVDEEITRTEGEIRKILTTNVMGEFGTRLILGAHLPPEEATRSAGGWGGDRYWLVEGEAGRKALVWSTVWDTQRNAEEFEKSLLRIRFFSSAVVIREGIRVILTLGLEEKTARLITARSLNSLKKAKSN